MVHGDLDTFAMVVECSFSGMVMNGKIFRKAIPVLAAIMTPIVDGMEHYERKTEVHYI